MATHSSTSYRVGSGVSSSMPKGSRGASSASGSARAAAEDDAFAAGSSSSGGIGGGGTGYALSFSWVSSALAAA